VTADPSNLCPMCTCANICAEKVLMMHSVLLEHSCNRRFPLSFI